MEGEVSGINYLKEKVGRLFKKPFKVEGLRTYAPFNPEYPYYPDLGSVPELLPETRLERRESVDLEKVPDKFLFGVTGKGHLGAIYTIQIHDALKSGRYLRMWRCEIGALSDQEERKRLQGQGLFVNLKDFAEDYFAFQPGKQGVIVKEGDRGVFPYFYEGEGPGGKIKVADSTKDEVSWCTKVGSILVPISL